MSSRRRDRKKASATEYVLRDQLDAQQHELDDLRNTSQPRATSVYIRERSLKKYTNSAEDPPILEWLESVERVTRGRSQQNIVDFMMEHLEGEAYAEVKHRPRNERSTPKEIFAILIQAFGDAHRSRVQRERQFFNRRQRDKENLRRFSHALMALAGKIPDIEDERDNLLKEQFAENVRNSELKRELKRLCRNDPDITFYELREEAMAWAGEDDNSDGSEDEDFRVKQQAIHQQNSASDPMDKVVSLLTDLTAALKVGQQPNCSPNNANATSSQPGACVSPQDGMSTPWLSMHQSQMYGTNSFHQPYMAPPPYPPAAPYYSYQMPQPGYNAPPAMLPQSRNGPQPAFTEDGRPICFRCGKVGHISRHCRSQPPGGQGHMLNGQNQGSRQLALPQAGNTSGGPMSNSYGTPSPGYAPGYVPVQRSTSISSPPNQQAFTQGQGNGRPQSQ